MKLPVNGARGEVGLAIGETEIVIAATMQGLSSVSTELGCKSFEDLITRLSQVEVTACVAGIKHLAVRGDVKTFLSLLKIKHFRVVADAFNAALEHHYVDEPGNGDAGEVKD